MEVSELLTKLGDLMQNAIYLTADLCKYGFFLQDVLCYICGEKLPYNLPDYSDVQDRVYWEDLQNGYCEFCWVNTDKGPYGFRIREEYAYLPCYEDFVKDLACELYGSIDEAAQGKVRKEIEHWGSWREKGSLDLEPLRKDKKLVEAVRLICPYFFVFVREQEDQIRALIYTFFEMLLICEDEIGAGEWKLLNIESPALNAWLQFLYCDEVSDLDRISSQQILSNLVKLSVTMENQNDELCMRSHAPASICFEKPQGKEQYIPFSISVMQNSYGVYNCNCEDSFFWFGLVNPHFLSAMVDAQKFLEGMDQKYHYLSTSSCKDAGMENAGEITGSGEKI